MSKLPMLAAATLCLLMSLPVTATDNWRLIISNSPEGQTPACLMESATRMINDGQTETPVKLVYTGQALYAVTKSHIDLSYPEVGIQVDKHQQHPIDRLHGQDTAVFNSHINVINKQLSAGNRAKLALGFWPTWPKTRTRIIEFSLGGFTRTYKQFKNCQAKSKHL